MFLKLMLPKVTLRLCFLFFLLLFKIGFGVEISTDREDLEKRDCFESLDNIEEESKDREPFVILGAEPLSAKEVISAKSFADMVSPVGA